MKRVRASLAGRRPFAPDGAQYSLGMAGVVRGTRILGHDDQASTKKYRMSLITLGLGMSSLPQQESDLWTGQTSLRRSLIASLLLFVKLAVDGWGIVA